MLPWQAIQKGLPCASPRPPRVTPRCSSQVRFGVSDVSSGHFFGWLSDHRASFARQQEAKAARDKAARGNKKKKMVKKEKKKKKKKTAPVWGSAQGGANQVGVKKEPSSARAKGGGGGDGGDGGESRTATQSEASRLAALTASKAKVCAAMLLGSFFIGQGRYTQN